MVSDHVEVRQILTNPMSNAVKFTEKGKIVMSLGGKGTRVIIAETDTGVSTFGKGTKFTVFSLCDI